MVKRVGTFRRKTRQKLAKNPRDKGKVSLSKFFQKVEIGMRVCLKAEPAHQKGMYFPRFHGLTGIIKSKRGRCYEIQIKDCGKEKTLLVHPVHFERVK